MFSAKDSVFAGMALACPLDGLVLDVDGGGLLCGAGHCYDIAKHGYVNLLPVQFKASRDPGDSKEMVVARRAVMDSGLYAPLAEALAGVVAEYAHKVGDAKLLVDAGCGEGYYTDRMAQALWSDVADGVWQVLGVDISKWAVSAAARRYGTIGWAVGTNKQLPVMVKAAGLITSVFGFEMWPQWAALQKEGQLVVVMDAGPRHLMELRELIYDEVRVHEVPDNTAALEAGYVQVDERRVSAQGRVESAQMLAWILEMTPHGHKMGAAGRERIKGVEALDLTLEGVMRIYRRG